MKPVEHGRDAELSHPAAWASGSRTGLTGCGWYAPASNCSRISGQCCPQVSGSSSTVIPSMPGLPLFCLTRFNARSAGSGARAPVSISRPVPGLAFSARSPSPFARSAAALGASPLLSNGSSSCPDFWGHDGPRRSVALPFLTFGPSARLACLLWPLLTSRSAASTRRHPFRRKARSPRIRTLAFAARPPDLRRRPFGHGSFAVIGPLALVGVASYPVSVRRPAASFHASFPTVGHPSALALRFPRYGQLTGGLSPPRYTSCWA